MSGREQIGKADLADIAEEAAKLAATVVKRTTEMLEKAGINVAVGSGNLATLIELYLQRQFKRGQRAAKAEESQVIPIRGRR